MKDGKNKHTGLAVVLGAAGCVAVALVFGPPGNGGQQLVASAQRASTPATTVTPVALADPPAPDNASTVSRCELERAIARPTRNDLGEIQAYARRMSFIEDRRQEAYEFMRKQQAAAGARLDLAGILGASRGYIRVLQATAKQFARVPLPKIADANAQRYLTIVDAEWKASVVSEEAKYKGIIRDAEAGIDGTDAAQDLTDEANGHLAKAITYVNKTYMIYGYQPRDVNDDMILRKGARPSAKTVLLQAEDCSA